MKPGPEPERSDDPLPTAPPVRRGSGFAALAFDTFQERLHRFLLRRLRSRENAEDLAQEVYLRLLRFSDGDLVKQPQAYLYQVAFNVLCEFKLQEKKQVVSFDSAAAAVVADKLAADSAPPEEALDRQTDERRLDAVLERLPPMQRAVFLLAIRHGLPHAEIARKLGISLHTVRKYLYRALHYCREQLADPRPEGTVR